MKKTRVYVPLPPETLETLQSLADVQGKSLAAVCGDLLVQATPMVAAMAQALRVVNEHPARALKELLDVAEQQVAALDQYKLDLAPGEVRKSG